jgi:hypothetical protein
MAQNALRCWHFGGSVVAAPVGIRTSNRKRQRVESANYDIAAPKQLRAIDDLNDTAVRRQLLQCVLASAGQHRKPDGNTRGCIADGEYPIEEVPQTATVEPEEVVNGDHAAPND